MKSIGQRFREWLLRQRVQGVVPVALDADRYRVELPFATGEVNIYASTDEEYEIAEYRIARKADDEAVFFLHVMLDDLARAEELFAEMAEALEDEAAHKTTRVLLTCTSAMTTTLFAMKMGEVAKALNLDYEFSALDVNSALRAPDDYAAVLLAPQVSHMRQQMVTAHPKAVVFEIPGKIFGSYDAAGAVRLLMHALREVHTPESATGLSAVRDLDDDRRILIITLFTLRDYARLGYRLYDHGIVVSQGAVRKPRVNFRDIEDLIETLAARDIDIAQIDAVGIAVPGVACRGVVTLDGITVTPYDLGRVLARRFGLPVYLDNNCNAAAVGCYVMQNEHESLIFFRHAFGHPAGGFGTVIDGKLLKGRGNLAGEPKYFEGHLAYSASHDEAIWSEQGMFDLAEGVVLAAVSLMAPEAVFLAVDTVDADELHAALAAELGEKYTPPIYTVTDYVERVYLGELAMALQKLRDPYYKSLGVGVWEGIEPRGM